MKSFVVTASGVVGSTLAFFFGGWDTSIAVLLSLMAIDYISGLIVAGVFHKSKKSESGALESNAGFKGLVKKGMILLYVVVGNLLDKQLGATFVRDGVCIAFIVNETISIIENGDLMGIPFPAVIKKALNLLNQKEEDSADDK